jgi:hypothetical protein
LRGAIVGADFRPFAGIRKLSQQLGETFATKAANLPTDYQVIIKNVIVFVSGFALIIVRFVVTKKLRGHLLAKPLNQLPEKLPDEVKANGLCSAFQEFVQERWSLFL